MPENHYYDYLVQQPLRTVAMLAASIAVYITYTFVSDYRRWIVFSKFLTFRVVGFVGQHGITAAEHGHDWHLSLIIFLTLLASLCTVYSHISSRQSSKM